MKRALLRTLAMTAGAALGLGCEPPPAAPPPVVAVPAVVASATAAPETRSRSDLACQGKTFLDAPPASLGGSLPAAATVAHVELRGTADAAALRGSLKTQAGASLDAARIRADVRALWDLGLFDDVTVLSDGPPADRTITFVVSERPRLGKLFFSGATHLDSNALTEAFDPAKIPRFDAAAASKGAARARDLYVEQGYRLARVEAKVHRLGEEADVCLVVDEGPKVTIDHWTFEGATQIPESEIRAAMATEGGRVNAPGGVYREEIWQRDSLLLTDRYYDRGMIQVRIAEPELVASNGGAALSVKVKIEEGAVFHLGAVKLGGEAVKKQSRRYAALLQSKKGDVFNRSKLHEDIARLREKLRGEGKRVEITPETELDAAKATVALTLVVEEMPKER